MYALLENTFKLFAMITIVVFFLPLKIVRQCNIIETVGKAFGYSAICIFFLPLKLLRELIHIAFVFTGLTTIRSKPTYRFVNVRTKRHHSFGY